VEEIIDERYCYENPHRTVLPAKFVDAVVEVPYGAHPCSCDTRYETDYKFIEMYVENCRDSRTFSAFLKKFIYDTKDHFEYLERLGLSRLLSIRRPEEVLCDN
jgi:glutaconate CoA-transferase subunit A